jgi:hypothetical protein
MYKLIDIYKSITEATVSDYYEGTYGDWEGMSKEEALEFMKQYLLYRKGKRKNSVIDVNGKHYTVDHESQKKLAKYRSRSNSFYFVSADGNELVRISDHWSSTGNAYPKSQKMNCGQINTCVWNVQNPDAFNIYLPGERYSGRFVGARINLSDLKKIDWYRSDKEQFNEGKQVGKLYHFTQISNLAEIAKSNTLRAHYSDREIAVSLSRGDEYDGDGANEHYSADVRITLDGDRLANKYKISPRLGGSHLSSTPDRSFRPEREERILQDIKNIKDYIIQIDILIDSRDHWDIIDGYMPDVRSAFAGIPILFHNVHGKTYRFPKVKS